MGHRGAAGLNTENTLASIRAAHGAGASSVEIDVTLLADDTVVVHHDKELGRVMAGQGELRFATLNDIPAFQPIQVLDKSKYDAELGIPTLAEVLSLVDELDIGLNIEIKNHGFDAAHLTELVLEAIERWNATDRCLLSSFDTSVLTHAKLVAPQWRRAWIVDDIPDHWLDTANHLSLYSIHANYLKITQSWIERAHRSQFYTYAWTVNDAADSQRLLQWGVDGIITDYPNRMKSLGQIE